MSITIKNKTNEAIATVEDTNDLRDAVIRLIRRGVCLRGADLRGADLRDANLIVANLRDANLSGANLRGADLSGADLRDADLRDANLSGADLRDANLRDANLRDADLRDADLRDANLSGADLRDANLRDANLIVANLQPIKDDLFAVLSYAPAEVSALITALEQGRVNGSTYTDGECGCLVGTLSMASGTSPTSTECSQVHGLSGNGNRPIERFFLAINKGDTPKTNQFSKLAHEWSTEWIDRIRSAFSSQEGGQS